MIFFAAVTLLFHKVRLERSFKATGKFADFGFKDIKIRKVKFILLCQTIITKT